MLTRSPTSTPRSSRRTASARRSTRERAGVARARRAWPERLPRTRVVGVGADLEVRLRLRVGPRGAGRGRRGEELEHAQRLVAVGEPVMPRVAAEEDALARLGAHDLAGLRVREHESALEDVEELVGGEDRAEALRVGEPPAGRHAEDDRVDQLGGDVDPVLDEARLPRRPTCGGRPRRRAARSARRRTGVGRAYSPSWLRRSWA